MTITQLEYIIAVDECKSFAKASEKCFVTQPTLSMQIKKLEKQLNVALFDRSKKPVRPTDIGKQVIEQARISLSELGRIQNIIESKEGDLSGEIRLGIIPTVSPYLLPLFANSFIKENPSIQLNVEENISEDIVYKLYNNELDIGILVTPLNSPNLIEIPLYYEPFVAYMPNSNSLDDNSKLDFRNLDLANMWLLRKGHCFRNQVLNICGEDIMEENKNALRLESGSLETLRRIVEKNYGYTLLPELAAIDFSPEYQKFVKEFSDPKPVREVSLIINQRFLRRQIVENLKKSILENIPAQLRSLRDGKVIHWQKESIEKINFKNL